MASAAEWTDRCDASAEFAAAYASARESVTHPCGRAALAYLNAWLSVIPLRPRSKAPATVHGLNDWTDNPGQVAVWWRDGTDYNVGAPLGQVSSGIIAIDLDEHGDGGASGSRTLQEYELAHGALPETWEQRTGGGGRQLFYRVDREVRSSANADLGVDIRGDGGYVVLPPSVHPDTGDEYEWTCSPEDMPVADATPEVYGFIEHVRPGGGGAGEGARFSLPERIGEGGRNDTLYRYACSMRARNFESSEIVAMLERVNRERCVPPLPDDELRSIASSAASLPAGRSDARVQGGGAGAGGNSSPGAPGAAARGKTWDALSLDGRGRPRKTISNAMAIVELDPLLAGRFRYSDFTRQRTVDLPVPWDAGSGTRPVADEDYIEAAAYAEREYGLVDKGKVTDAVMSVCSRSRYNEVRDWLTSLTWDGVPRVETMLQTWLGARDDAYVRAVMRTWMRGAVARVMDPGCKFELVPVLIGPQGTGKSTFVGLLAHDERWYSDGLSTIEGDAAIEKLRGIWVVEIGELLGLKRSKDVNAVKAFVSTQADNIRPKYGRETQRWPRMCAFIGTTNDSTFLTDRTGNRRFAPIECFVEEPRRDVFDASPWRADWFEQAWAEAVHDYLAAGERQRLDLPPEVRGMAERARDEHMEDDPRVGMIQRYLDEHYERVKAGSMTERVCAQELATRALKMRDDSEIPPRTINSIHAIMQHDIDGWVRLPGRQRTTDFGVQRVYVKETSVRFYGQ